MSKDQWSIKEVIELLRGNAEADKDNIIGVDGLTGAGKSTAAIKLCMRGCPWFNLEKDLLYSKDEIMEWVINAKHGSWAIADEAVNVLFKRDFANKSQKFLIKIFDMCRDRNLTLFLCIPNFWALDKHMLDGRIRMRIHIARTGLAFIWKPTGNPFTPDKWNRKLNEKICARWDVSPNARRTKGFMGVMKFGDVTPQTKELYLKIKQEKKDMIKRLEEESERIEEERKNKIAIESETKILYILRERGLLKPSALVQLAMAQGMSKQLLNDRLTRYKEKILKATKANIDPLEVKNVKKNYPYSNQLTWVTNPEN